MKTKQKGLTNLISVKRKEIKKIVCFGLFGLAIIVLLVTYASSAKNKAMARCIFCDIVAGKSPSTKIEVETDEYVIFKDIKPASTHHYLCVTKKHIDSLKSMTKDDIPLINRMEEGLKQFYKSQGIDTNDALFGFHMPPFISVKHLHMHGIQPKSNMSWTNRITFKPFTYWFKTVEEAKDYLVTCRYYLTTLNTSTLLFALQFLNQIYCLQETGTDGKPLAKVATFHFPEYAYKETSKNELTYHDFEVTCDHHEACGNLEGIKRKACVRRCISYSCYQDIYAFDELEEGEIDVRLNSFKGCVIQRTGNTNRRAT